MGAITHLLRTHTIFLHADYKIYQLFSLESRQDKKLSDTAENLVHPFKQNINPFIA